MIFNDVLMGLFWDLLGYMTVYPLVNVYSLLLNQAIEIVDLPIKNSGFP